VGVSSLERGDGFVSNGGNPGAAIVRIFFRENNRRIQTIRMFQSWVSALNVSLPFYPANNGLLERVAATRCVIVKCCRSGEFSSWRNNALFTTHFNAVTCSLLTTNENSAASI
jgi:hypothetical protein